VREEQFRKYWQYIQLQVVTKNDQPCVFEWATKVYLI